MLEGALGRLCARSQMAIEIVRLGDEPPGPRQTQLVAQLLEHCNCAVAHVEELLRGHLSLIE